MGTPAVVIPFPKARVPKSTIVVSKLSSYDELAESIGFAPAELVRAQLLAFFEEERIKLYNYNEVNNWLVEKMSKIGAKCWCWRSLREKDIITGYGWGWDSEWLRYKNGFYSWNHGSCRLYERLVPFHALDKVAKIEAKFGDRVKFFVSDYVSSDPDPFIMVRPATRDSGTDEEYNLIFDNWDEPGFGVVT